MIVILEGKATGGDIKKASEEFGDYIKVVADIEKKILAIGGKLHADAEKLLIENGSFQNNLWGGGIDISSGVVDAQAMINIRPKQGNDNMEILDAKIRKSFFDIVEKLMK